MKNFIMKSVALLKDGAIPVIVNIKSTEISKARAMIVNCSSFEDLDMLQGGGFISFLVNKALFDDQDGIFQKELNKIGSILWCDFYKNVREIEEVIYK